MKFRKTLMTLSLILLTSCTGLEEFNNGLNNLNNKLGSINKKLGNSSATSSSVSTTSNNKIILTNKIKENKYIKFNKLELNHVGSGIYGLRIEYENKVNMSYYIDISFIVQDSKGKFHRVEPEKMRTSGSIYGYLVLAKNIDLNNGKDEISGAVLLGDAKYIRTEIEFRTDEPLKTIYKTTLK